MNEDINNKLFELTFEINKLQQKRDSFIGTEYSKERMDNEYMCSYQILQKEGEIYNILKEYFCI